MLVWRTRPYLPSLSTILKVFLFFASLDKVQLFLGQLSYELLVLKLTPRATGTLCLLSVSSFSFVKVNVPHIFTLSLLWGSQVVVLLIVSVLFYRMFLIRDKSIDDKTIVILLWDEVEFLVWT